ncbi:Coiled-coil domain-containing protein 22, putative isoform 1 [Theobroma cacao]|uniref:Coiled-coil domain-containing protein 22, putative isoform 1 n=2 Tax=Theobroma cacao TaxID=3641 RepID=A0A061F4X0_THECC|nr:Coiled-coil domain-containing protein 22, putative isoform 1 [Theobroma cacao]
MGFLEMPFALLSLSKKRGSSFSPFPTAMEGSQEITLDSLGRFGVSIPENVSSFNDLTPTTLISICCQSLNLLGNIKDEYGNDMSFPSSVEDSVSMDDKFGICSDISLAFKNLGYVGDINYSKFLYPSEEDSYMLVRFLVERFSGSSEAVKFSAKGNVGMRQNNFEKISEYFAQEPNNEEVDLNLQKVEAILKDLRVDELLESSSLKTDDAPVAVNDPLRVHDMPQTELFSESTAEVVESRSGASENEETADQKDDEHVSTSHKESKIQYEAENLLSQEKVLKEELGASALQVQHLEEEFGLWKAAADMAFDESHPMEFFLEQLNKQVDAKKHNIGELESQWDTFRNPLEQKKRSLEECLYANNPGAQEKLQKLRDIELDIQFTLSEIRKREEEHLELSADLRKQPKVASRRSYTERIKEITKNSGKLDTDIERILRETRELQLESNSLQERLHRTYAVVDEIVFREAKKNPVGRQAYRLLTSIHESFEQISEKILSTDRIRREMADHEKKLAAMASRS